MGGYLNLKVKNLIVYDHNKHYSSCFMGENCTCWWPVYSVFDEVKPFDGNIEAGYYYLDTDNFFSFEVAGWYDADLVFYAFKWLPFKNFLHISIFPADHLFLTKFRKIRNPSENLGNFMICSKISENFRRFLTTKTDFGTIPNMIYDTDVFFLSWLFVEGFRSFRKFQKKS